MAKHTRSLHHPGAQKAVVRVLHVDDDPAFLKVSKECLEMEGPFDVEIASSVKEALCKMKETTYDAIVSDYAMPGQDGLEFLKDLRNKKNKIPFILLTGKGMKEKLAEALDRGADYYVIKTGDSETMYSELAHRILQAVEKRTQYRLGEDTLKKSCTETEETAEKRTAELLKENQLLKLEVEELRNVEKTLRESEDRYRSVFEESREAICITSPEGDILEANEACASLLGYTRDEMMELNAWKAYANSEDCSKFQQEIEHRGSVKDYEVKIRRKDGTVLDCLLTAVVQRAEDGTVSRYQGVLRDITASKQAEEQLRESERRYRAVVEDQTELICRFSPDGKLTFVNEAYARYFDKKKEELEGHSFMPLIPEEDRKKAEDNLTSLSIDNPVATVEHRVIAPGGEVRWQQWTDRAIFDDEGHLMEIQSVGRDTTERKEAEERLRESEEKYRNIVELAPYGIATIDLEGVVTSCNTAFLLLTGFCREEIVGTPIAQLPTIPPDDLPEYLRLFDSLLNGKEFIPTEMRWVHKDGTIHHGEIHAILMKKRGRTVGVQVIARDITEHKQTQVALQAEREKLRALMDGLDRTGIGIDVVGTDHRILLQNEVLRKEFGDLTGQICYKAYIGSQTPCEACPMIKAARKNTVEAVELVNKHGRYIRLISAPLPNPDGTADKAIEVAIDITERIEAEKALRESQLKFKKLFMDNPEAAAYLNSEFHIVDINPRFEALFGYSLEEIEGSHINIIVPPEKAGEADVLDKKAVKEHVYHDTIRMRKNRSLVPVSVSAAPITVEDQLIGYVALYKDISQLKKTEEALKKTLEKLEAMNEKLRVVGSMTRHDVRNKLSTISGALYLARRKGVEEKTLEIFKEIEATCQQMERILDFAKTYEKLGIEQLYHVSVKENVDEARSLFSDNNNITVDNQCQGLTVLADSLLRHLFYDLIDNSLRHGKTVTTIRVYYKEKKDMIILVYEDNGVGVPFSEKENIFKEGYGTDTGYGLYIIKKICEAYHWTIKEAGIPGKGATFIMHIPSGKRNGKTTYEIFT